MILEKASLIKTSNVAKSSWSGLRKYHNIDYVEKTIVDLHKIPHKHRKNVRKQAEQIRYCLMQAREYYEASQVVSLVTKPMLLYYSVMSLALAEILMKQDGGSSLDKARGKNAHHGLLFRNDSITNNDEKNHDINFAGECLRALPMCSSGIRSGTFELWHSSSRDYPTLGEISNTLKTGLVNVGYGGIFFTDDSREKMLPEKGISLLECLKHLPKMVSYLESSGVDTLLVRANIRLFSDENKKQNRLSIIIHPTNTQLLSRICDGFKLPADLVNYTDIIDAGNGLALDIKSDNDSDKMIKFPRCTTLNKRESFFSVDNHGLNEFGLYYVALYICGNYARYFPDQWVYNVERSTPLALVIEEMISHAEERVPLLAYSELSRVYFVND